MVTFLGVWAIGEWIIDNWVKVVLVTTLLILLGLSGNLSRMFRDAAKGLKESMTLPGFIILGVIIYIIYQIYLSFVATLP